MRLLVTRPADEATATAARLNAQGHTTLIQPLLAYESLRPPELKDRPGAIALTSRNAVRALGDWPFAAKWRSLPVFAVGDATAAAARDAGFTAVRSAAGDGLALARLVAGSLKPRDGTVLYPAAANRSPVFETELKGSGFTVETVIAYRMIPAQKLDAGVKAALSSGALDGVLFYSPRTASVFRDLVTAAGILPALAKVTVFAISEATAAALQGTATAALRIAVTPDEEAMMRLIGPAGKAGASPRS